MKQIVLVSSIGADEPFFPLNLLWGVSHTSVSECETVHGNHPLQDDCVVRRVYRLDANHCCESETIAGPHTIAVGLSEKALREYPCLQG